jgi:hypothetical protein
MNVPIQVKKSVQIALITRSVETMTLIPVLIGHQAIPAPQAKSAKMANA